MPPIGKSPFICSFRYLKSIHDTGVSAIRIYNDNNARSRWLGGLPVYIGFFSFYALPRLSFRSVSVPIAAHHQPFNVRFLVENLAA